VFDFTRNHRRSLIDITSRCREDYKSASMVNCSPVAETLKIEDMKMQDVQRGPNKVSHSQRPPTSQVTWWSVSSQTVVTYEIKLL